MSDAPQNNPQFKSFDNERIRTSGDIPLAQHENDHESHFKLICSTGTTSLIKRHSNYR